MLIIVEDIKRVIGKIVRQQLEELNTEIQEYFKMIKKILINDVEKKLNKPETEILKSFNLTSENFEDLIYLPEILELARYMKENNFNNFDKGWNTYGYYHHDHAYNIKNIISYLQPFSRVIEELRLDISIKEKQETKEKFIEGDFQIYNLPAFESLKESINRAAYDDILYRILPILLRTMFENLLWYIFKDGLSKKHTMLFFNPPKNRIRDFSQLIEVLNFLKDKEFKPYTRESINQETINMLKEIQKIGNYTVHDVIEKVTKDFSKEWKDKVGLILKSLLVCHNNIKGKNIRIEENRERQLKTRLGIEKTSFKKEKVKEKISLKPKSSELSSNFIQELEKIDDLYVHNHFEKGFKILDKLIETQPSNYELKIYLAIWFLYKYFDYKTEKSESNALAELESNMNEYYESFLLKQTDINKIERDFFKFVHIFNHFRSFGKDIKKKKLASKEFNNLIYIFINSYINADLIKSQNFIEKIRKRIPELLGDSNEIILQFFEGFLNLLFENHKLAKNNFYEIFNIIVRPGNLETEKDLISISFNRDLLEFKNIGMISYVCLIITIIFQKERTDIKKLKNIKNSMGHFSRNNMWISFSSRFEEVLENVFLNIKTFQKENKIFNVDLKKLELIVKALYEYKIDKVKPFKWK